MPGSIPAPQPANLKFHIYFMLSQGKKFLWSHLPVFQNHPTSLVSQCVCAQLLNHARLIGASWTLACQAPLPMEFSRQEHWSGFPFPPPYKGQLETNIVPYLPSRYPNADVVYSYNLFVDKLVSFCETMELDQVIIICTFLNSKSFSLHIFIFIYCLNNR